MLGAVLFHLLHSLPSRRRPAIRVYMWLEVAFCLFALGAVRQFYCTKANTMSVFAPGSAVRRQ